MKNRYERIQGCFQVNVKQKRKTFILPLLCCIQRAHYKKSSTEMTKAQYYYVRQGF